MDFLEEYKTETLWHQKIWLMDTFHSLMGVKHGKWTLHQTAESFNVSMGVVSENLNLAKAIETDPELTKCESRQKALDKLK